jgi:hypothetical protein
MFAKDADESGRTRLVAHCEFVHQYIVIAKSLPYESRQFRYWLNGDVFAMRCAKEYLS